VPTALSFLAMTFTTRPTLRGYGGAVCAGHYLATAIGARTLADGGNAADAACAMGLALHVLEPHMNGIAGEVPVLYYEAASDRVHAISGQGVAPARATIDAFSELDLDRIPGSGFLAATVPAALDAWCILLERFGTRSFAEVSAPARGLAENGFPLYPFLRDTLLALDKKFQSQWPTSAALYNPVPPVGGRMRNPALARVFAHLATAERDARGGREQGIRAARTAFYAGWVAEEIEAFVGVPVPDDEGRMHAGFLDADDLAGYQGEVDAPLSVDYRGATVFKCPPWTQGPVFLQQLRLLECYDLVALEYPSAESLHIWIEAAKLAFADRDANYGDPRFADVPLERLLSRTYAVERSKLIADRASFEFRPGCGRLPVGWPWIDDGDLIPAEPQAFAAARGRGDTTHLDALDRDGNLAAATPSGAWVMSSPVIPSLGFPIGTRAQMFCLDPSHPNGLAPGKRPRTTLTPSLANLPDGRRIAFGTPGGDQQDQWTLQFFLHLVDAPRGTTDDRVDLQAAIDAPTLHTLHLPSSFYPRTAQPGWVAVEARMPADLVAELERRGHRVTSSGPWEHGRVMGVTHDAARGLCEGAASPRSQVAYAAVLP